MIGDVNASETSAYNVEGHLHIVGSTHKAGGAVWWVAEK
jgi:hypothetical protein